MSTVITDEQALANLSRNLRQALEDRGMTQATLARLTGDGEMNISRYVRGIQMPGAGVLVRLAEALDLTADELVASRKLAKIR